MKLEKFKKYGVRNKKIIYSIVGIVLLIGSFILFKSFAFFESKYDFNVIKGKIPEFNTGDIQLAFTIDGVKVNDMFPNKEDGYVVKSVTCQNGVTVNWDNETWSLQNIKNPNGNKKINCNIDFEPTLYKVVNKDDLVSYTPSNTSYTISGSLNGYSDQTINPSELDLWRVIRKNEDGTIEMISEYTSSKNVYFRGYDGSKNFTVTARTIAKQYETNGITSGSRLMGGEGNFGSSLVLEDIGSLKAYKKGTKEYARYFLTGAGYNYNFTGDHDRSFECRPIVLETGLVECLWICWWESGMKWCENSININAYLRPIVSLKKNILFVSGDGSENYPWKIN